MSALRNSLHRRTHKERSQLSHRAKFGILEKHKDYVLRARDYHSKQERINRLQQKAADRNKDEFYFSMNRQKTQGGVHMQDRGNASLPVDFVKVLKTQDENYIRTMRAAGLRKIEKLKAQLTELADLIAPQVVNGKEQSDEERGLEEYELEVLQQAGIIKSGKSRGQKAKPKHIIFVDNEQDARHYVSRSASMTESSAILTEDRDDDEETPIDLGWNDGKEAKGTKKSRRTRKDDVERNDELDSAVATEKRENAAKKHRTRLLKELSARLVRDTHLRYAERELAMQRALMGKGGSLKLKGVEKIDADVDANELNEDELDSMKIKKSDRIAAKKNETYKPRVYRWRSERKK